jgi:hypothetical protein
MPALKIVRATVILEEDGTRYTVRYVFENGESAEFSGLSKEEAERRADRVGHYIQLPD